LSQETIIVRLVFHAELESSTQKEAPVQ